jgi:hypothetical protein
VKHLKIWEPGYLVTVQTLMTGLPNWDVSRVRATFVTSSLRLILRKLVTPCKFGTFEVFFVT